MNKKEDALLLLQKLNKLYPTDKGEHGYLPHYAQFLPEKCRLMLEIGIDKGYSALMWKGFYGEGLYGDELDLHVLDLFLDHEHASTQWCKNNGITPIQGDQGDLRVLSRITDQYEVIVEDGSHRSDHQIITFKHLFLNNLRPGGIYFLEDAHCCLYESYHAGLAIGVRNTALAMFKDFKDTGEIMNPYFNKSEEELYKSLIKSVEFRADSKLIIITKAD